MNTEKTKTDKTDKEGIIMPREMELALMNIGYDEEYLATLGSSAIEELYREEIKL